MPSQKWLVCCDQAELVAKQHQLLSIPMMAEVLGWRERVAAEPVAEPLVHILDVCSERLLANFERYVHDSVSTCLPAYLRAHFMPAHAGRVQTQAHGKLVGYSS